MPRFLTILVAALILLPDSARPDETTTFYPTRYFPDSPDRAGAAPIPLAPGETSPPLVLTLAPRGGSIEIHVVSEDDASPIEGILVEALAGRFVCAARTGPDGGAMLTGVPAGRVLVRTRPDDPRSAEGAFAARYLPGVVDPRDATVFTTTDGGSIDAGTIALPSAGRIKVTCLRPGGGAWGGVPAILRSADGSVRRQIRTALDGRAHFGGLEPGAYRLWIDALGTDAITECSDGTRDTLVASEIFLSRGDLLSGISISPDLGATISGTVRHIASNAGLPDIEVRAVSQQVQPRFYTGRTDPLGFYSIRGLPSGIYKVYVPAIRRWFPEATSEAEARNVTAREPDETSQINVRGLPSPECELPPAQAGAVQGNIRADFGIMPSAVIEIQGDQDTVRQTISEPGNYRVGCIRQGSYRAVLLPDGGYRTQYHRKTNAADSASIFTVAMAETVFAIDFEPQRSVVLEGMVVSSEGGTGLEGIPVFAEMDDSRIVARTVTDAAGGFRIDRLSDKTGLPEGIWRVGTDSTIVGTIAPTALSTISISTHRVPEGVRIEFHLGDLDPIDWRLERDDGGRTPVVPSEARLHPGGSHARSVIDPEGSAASSYRLTIWIARENEPRMMYSEWAAAPQEGAGARPIYPSPWDGRTALCLPEAPSAIGRIDLIAADGSRVASLTARGERLDPLPDGVPSGIYFLRWRTVLGIERTERMVLKR